ncbi:hypothetical protein CROQUDRAFT_726273 [Cronartium quercuum f. sp. fusiforme G11]|uniref:Uncharacterized protein n=1 Tax=Cronartium quercuum f. sp. fusiforme G11 TaxID=708437 RepID=A0A9P6T694_9BASI|nr:hypothetical protein CROQUDRAFT_726273 [Cronartium quercuum f. sp. fusiforme G11]
MLPSRPTLNRSRPNSISEAEFLAGLDHDDIDDPLLDQNSFDTHFPNEVLFPDLPPTPKLKPASPSAILSVPTTRPSQQKTITPDNIPPVGSQKMDLTSVNVSPPSKLAVDPSSSTREEPAIKPTRDTISSNRTREILPSPPPSPLTPPVPIVSATSSRPFLAQDGAGSKTSTRPPATIPPAKTMVDNLPPANVSANQSQASPIPKMSNTTMEVNTTEASTNSIEFVNMTELSQNVPAPLPSSIPPNGTSQGRVSNVTQQLPASAPVNAANISGSESTSVINKPGLRPGLIIAVVVPVAVALIGVSLMLVYVRMKRTSNGGSIFSKRRRQNETPSWDFQPPGMQHQLGKRESELYRSDSVSTTNSSSMGAEMDPEHAAYLPNLEFPCLPSGDDKKSVNDTSSSSLACVAAKTPSLSSPSTEQRQSLQIAKKFLRTPNSSSYPFKSHLPSRLTARPVVDKVPIRPPEQPGSPNKSRPSEQPGVTQGSLRAYGQAISDSQK